MSYNTSIAATQLHQILHKNCYDTKTLNISRTSYLRANIKYTLKSANGRDITKRAIIDVNSIVSEWNYIPVKSTDFGGSLPIFYLPTANLPIYHNLPISTDFFADLPNFNFF